MSFYNNTSQEGFQFAYELACKKLASMDPEEVCRKSGAHYMDRDSIVVNYLNRPYLVTVSSGKISSKDDKEEISLSEKILILHYLTQAKGIPFTNKLITYGQLRGGRFYSPAFLKRTLDPILKCFGDKPELLLDVAQRLGGNRARYGDVSVNVDVFPLVRIVIILWRGDDEVPHGGNILFDKNIADYLSSEDVAVISETLIWKLINLTKTSPH